MSADAGFFAHARTHLARTAVLRPQGRVRACSGQAVEVTGLARPLGARCRIASERAQPVDAQVVGFRHGALLLMPFASAEGLQPGARVWPLDGAEQVPLARACLGRVIDGRGNPIDGGPPLVLSGRAGVQARPVGALLREPIHRSLDVGVRAINGLLSIGRGARMGLFAGSGVGKSTLLGQVARYTEAEYRVIALVGERGREVREFIERDLGDALAHSIVVVATSDEAALLRVRAAQLATALAEQLRDAGGHVLLLMDSLTRFSLAVREIGLVAGEPPTTRGYTPSVFSTLPQLLERAGAVEGGGSITGIYSVLVEGDDPDEPIADAARSMLDVHIWLTRELAERGHFPPIDVGRSVSRVMAEVASPAHRALASRARDLLAAWRDAHDLISIGAYVDGSDPRVDEARRRIGDIDAFLRQDVAERSDWRGAVEGLRQVLEGGAS